MPRDQFAEINPGDRLPGLPHAPWNGMLRSLKPKAGAAPDGRPDTSVEISVRNATGSPLGRFAVVGLAAPTITYAADQNTFFSADLMEATTPTAGGAFAVLLGPLSAGAIGPARLLGLTRCRVNLTTTTHRYADCTTATDKLTSATSGPARILWTEDNFAATGDKWAVAELLGQAATAGGSISVPIDSSTGALTFTGFGSGTIISLNFGATGTYLVTAQITVRMTNSGGAPTSVGGDGIATGGFTTGTGSRYPGTAYTTSVALLTAGGGFNEESITAVFLIVVSSLSGGTAVAPVTFTCASAGGGVTTTVAASRPVMAVKLA